VIKEEQVGNPVGTEEFAYDFSLWCENVADFFPRIRSYEKLLNIASVPANSTAEQTFTVTGVSVDDMVIGINKPSHTADLAIINTRVSAKDTIAITFENSSGSAIDPAAETYSIAVLRK